MPNVDEWEEQEIVFENKSFIRMYTRSFLFVPINMAKVMASLQQTVESAGVEMPPQDAMILSRDLSPWKAEQLYAVSQPFKGADNVTLSGKFLTKVFEGPYQNAKKWYGSLQNLASSRGEKVTAIYFFYTTCPKCAKHYGENYTIGMAAVD